jgi:hypothetical protein
MNNKTTNCHSTREGGNRKEPGNCPRRDGKICACITHICCIVPKGTQEQLRLATLKRRVNKHTQC